MARVPAMWRSFFDSEKITRDRLEAELKNIKSTVDVALKDEFESIRMGLNIYLKSGGSLNQPVMFVDGVEQRIQAVINRIFPSWPYG